MAHPRRSPHHRAPSSSISSPVTTRRNTLRRATTQGSSHAPSQSISSPLPVHRRVLVPVQPNLRRQPSRRLLLKGQDTDIEMRDSSHIVQVGAKRKRVASTNENAHTHGRPARGAGKLKRQKSVNTTRRFDESDNESTSEASGMEVDTASGQWSGSGDSEKEQQEEDAGSNNSEEESSDDHLIHSAPPHQLSRLKKTELLTLYTLAGLTDDAQSWTKSEIVAAIVAARDDFAEGPPSSPPGPGDGLSSDYSSDDGNVAGDEETDALPRVPRAEPLRRRATLNDVSMMNGRPTKGRSSSMGNLLIRGEVLAPSVNGRKNSLRINTEASGSSNSRRRTSNRSSPTTSATASAVTLSPPITRLRSRKLSGTSTAGPPTPTSTTTHSKGKGKGKAKQVEFSQHVEVRPKTSSTRSAKERERERDREQARSVEEDSDLTELEELEHSSCVANLAQPSPRRLRSKDREQPKHSGKENVQLVTSGASGSRAKKSKGKERDDNHLSNHVRTTPLRKAKAKIGSLMESDDDVEEEEEEEEEEDELLDELQEEEQEEGEQEDEDEEMEEEDEIDELVSTASTTPPVSTTRGRRTPLRKRLRSRAKPRLSLSDGDEENEGDDEEEEEEEDEEEEGEGEDAEEEAEEAAEEEAEEGDDEITIAVEPRRLRNGKIVGEEDVDMEEDIGEEDEEEEVEEEDAGEEEEVEGEEAEEEVTEEDGETQEEDEGVDVEDIDVDADGETDEDEPMEENIDLDGATKKTLVRLRRDALVRLCESRDLEPVGTKPQLADALLQWRNQQSNDFSSPSSIGTVRPPSTARRGRRNTHNSNGSTNTPVLLRSEHVHQDEPRTPVPGKENGKEKEEPELELDLSSLGLVDREIPPEKLTKLEKIGSGGFKDVFIGKFKGRKVAISEFRGQLSAMDIKELKLLGGFDHKNIVRFVGVSIPENTKETPVMIVSELCSNGDLFDYVRNVNPPTLHKVLQMMLDIARGLEYLHTQKPSIIHRDCKSSNILITARGGAKIADFGLAKVKQSTRSMVRSLVGTVNWQAPELWHAHPKYNHKVDVFSCAMVYWEMLQWHLPNKKFPWEGMNEHAIYDTVGAKRQRPPISGLRKQWCPEIVDLIDRMWAQEHQDRPTMTEVVHALEDILKAYPR
ncbi:hypothetical protein BDQ12DRAFT_597055 [Crucibulum laeve]|uniref:Protein kinase domain-containing protein n=1 Tax=Crucibulum laeve TaxID=68775 RepID=A0A5C3MMF0_9AGAR|nr:hypothetical protein BDQ12DRAFT_597055 [Crucibulum laeve]